MAVKSLSSSGNKRSRLPVVQGKFYQQQSTKLPNNFQFSSINKYDSSYSQNTSTNNTTGNEFKSGVINSSAEQNHMSTRRNLFHHQPFQSQWAAATPASEDGEVESQGQESVRKFCTEDTPISLSKAGSNTNLSSLTFDDEEHINTGNAKYVTKAPGRHLTKG